ncbi:hypothetical protein ACS0TY_025255 [Phlomoides rotata]
MHRKPNTYLLTEVELGYIQRALQDAPHTSITRPQQALLSGLCNFMKWKLGYRIELAVSSLAAVMNLISSSSPLLRWGLWLQDSWTVLTTQSRSPEISRKYGAMVHIEASTLKLYHLRTLLGFAPFNAQPWAESVFPGSGTWNACGGSVCLTLSFWVTYCDPSLRNGPSNASHNRCCVYLTPWMEVWTLSRLACCIVPLTLTFKVPELGKVDSAYTSFSSKEKGQQIEPSQGALDIELGQAITASKPDISDQLGISGVKEEEINLRHQKGTEFRNPELFITDVSGKYPRLWALKRVDPNDVRMWCNFGALASICTIAPNWVVNADQESWSHNPHLKRGKELEIKFITAASEDTTYSIRYPSFHFMKLQRLDKRVFTYIKEQETKPELVIDLTEDEISTRRA